MPMRAVLLWGGLLVLSACATKTFSPDQAPEYTITRSFTPFYSERPVAGATTDISLSEKTRVKLLRKEMGYSLVQLEDSREGYVANKNMVVAPPGSQDRPFGSTVDESRPKPRRKKRIIRATATPTPVSLSEQPAPTPQEAATPPSATPTPQTAPNEPPVPTPAPTPTPTPQATPLEKPKFRL
ncbi:MAG TPA: hypothetical protein VFO90_04080 [Terrimicrobiaceae bacterium]|nr:hypothetical protein [Terrimicrobiaceae bacterium]